jgi:EAL domain-containing protein (putative c-di-GMP-specific phosphodiesterase class I)
VAINLSALQMRLGCCAHQLAQAMDAHRVHGGQLEIEITESVLLDDMPVAIDCLHTFKGLGVSIALDDFGTGCSSLSYLNRLPIDSIKVDRVFVQQSDAGGDGARIAEMIVTLARHLNLATVAEGIETERQHATAQRWGCSRAQGFLYAPALPPLDFAAWARAHL